MPPPPGVGIAFAIQTIEGWLQTAGGRTTGDRITGDQGPGSGPVIGCHI